MDAFAAAIKVNHNHFIWSQGAAHCAFASSCVSHSDSSFFGENGRTDGRATVLVGGTCRKGSPAPNAHAAAPTARIHHWLALFS